MLFFYSSIFCVIFRALVGSSANLLLAPVANSFVLDLEALYHRPLPSHPRYVLQTCCTIPHLKGFRTFWESEIPYTIGWSADQARNIGHPVDKCRYLSRCFHFLVQLVIIKKNIRQAQGYVKKQQITRQIDR